MLSNNLNNDLSRLQKGSSGFTLRAFVVGTLLCFCIGVGPLYANMVIRGSYLSLDFSTAGAIFLLFVFVGIINVILGLIHRSLALTRPELLMVYIMMIVASAIPTMGLTEYLLPIITGVYYYATPENDWASLIHPHIPSWLAPQSPEGIKYFYEGLPSGQPMPWRIWVIPLMAWCAFLFVLYFAMICIMVILRKQWTEKERLIYPLVHVPMEMTRDDQKGSLIRPFFKNPVMWIGFAVPIIVGSTIALHKYYYFLPTIQLQTYIPIFRRTTSLKIALSFPMVGFSYFINLDIAFGLWFFNVLAKVQQGIFGITGYASTEKVDIYSIPQYPMLAHQGLGAMAVLVLFGLWVARGHLKEVFRKAFLRDEDVDDSQEILSYRTAVFGLIGSLLFMQCWLWLSGTPFWMVPLFLFVSFLLFVGITRIVAEGGVAAARAPMIPSTFVISGIGSPVVGTAGLVSMAFTYVWVADVRTFVMASCANGLKLGQELGHRKKALFWAMLIAIGVSLASSIWVILVLAYKHGGINLNQWFFGGGVRAPFEFISTRLTTPTSVHWGGWLFTLIGGGVMALLMLARQRLLWWPLHPLGFPISAIMTTDHIAFSVFLAWLIKTLVLKYGGPRLYKSTRPFFLGLILGQFVCAGMWLIIDYFTGMTDNMIYWV